MKINKKQQKFLVIGIIAFALWLLLLVFTNNHIGKMLYENLTLVFGVIGSLGTVFTLIGLLIKRPSHPKSFGKNTLCWAELDNATSNLATAIAKLKLNKEYIIFAIDAKTATIAETVRNTLSVEIPIYVGTSTWIKDLADSAISNIPTSFKTRKWSICVSNDIFKFKQKKVLVIHDFVISGDIMVKAKDFLIANGFEENNIKTYCLVATATALDDGNVDEHWLKIDNTEFYFPWGKAR